MNLLSQQGLELSSHRLQGIFLRHKVSIRTSQVTHQHHRFGPIVQAVLDAGNCRLDPKNQRDSIFWLSKSNVLQFRT